MDKNGSKDGGTLDARNNSNPERLLDAFFKQSLDGFFFSMLDEGKTINWKDSPNKEEMLDYALNNMKIIRINEAMAKQYGGVPNDFLGLTLTNLYGSSREYAKQLCRVLFDRGYIHFEDKIDYNLDGKETWVEGNYVCIYDDDGNITGYFGVQRDITERKRAEEEKKKMQDQLAHTERIASIGMLAGGVAHEINNPLTVVLGYTALLKESLKGDEYDMIDEIEEAALRIKHIVADLLEFSRRDTDEQKEVSTVKLVDKVLSMLSYEIKSSNIIIEKEMDDVVVTCQQDRIVQVLVNLINNAIYALNLRYPKRDENKVLRIKTYTKGDDVIIEVEDHGVGIPEGTREHLFEPFFTTKPHGEGTGLGLPVSYSIVKAHGGELNVESKEGEKTKFTIKLPLKLPLQS
ncbi:MAG: sensor histidine kinase [Methermicoccaceae archaeon]